MKKVIILVLMLASFFSCRSQSKVDAILSKKADSLDVNDINVLIKSGYIRDADPVIIGTVIVSVSQRHTISNWTIRQLLDSVKANMKKMDDSIAIQHNYGKDSVFIRDPRGNRMFVGMGELSFDKMVTLASRNLPANYSGDYDLKINSTEVLKKIGLLISQSEHAVIIGNVFLSEKDSGELKNLKIGDIFEISRRIASSKEFAPFLEQIK